MTDTFAESISGYPFGPRGATSILGRAGYGQVVALYRAGIWKIEASLLPRRWKGLLKTRIERSLGEECPVWCYGLNRSRKTAFLSDSLFGITPISEKTHATYSNALVGMLEGFNTGTPGAFDPEHLSVVKGMFNRTVRKDQSDWYLVWTLLGCPEPRQASILAEVLGDLGRTLRGGEDESESAEIDFEDLMKLKLPATLKSARTHLKSLTAASVGKELQVTPHPLVRDRMETALAEGIPRKIRKVASRFGLRLES